MAKHRIIQNPKGKPSVPRRKIRKAVKKVIQKRLTIEDCKRLIKKLEETQQKDFVIAICPACNNMIIFRSLEIHCPYEKK